MKNKKRGFTLIELLVVIAIIGLLSSVVMASLNSARVKARDAKRLSDFRAVNTAMELYYDAVGAYPGDNTLYANTNVSHRAQFEAMTGQLVSRGFLSAIPKDPINVDPYLYMYYNYGSGNGAGAIIVTNLEGISNTTVGPFNSCRPFGANWCSNINPGPWYCSCHPY